MGLSRWAKTTTRRREKGMTACTLTAHPQSSNNEFQRKLQRLQFAFRNAIFPLTPLVLAHIITILIVLDIFGKSFLDAPTTLIREFADSFIPFPAASMLIAMALVITPAVCAIVFLVRLAFTLMLYYRGFLFEEIGKPPSLATKIFMVIITYVNKNATFLSYQKLLPWQTIPSISSTIPKFLESVEPFMSDEEFCAVKAQANEFVESGTAWKIQMNLYFKWCISQNWVSDWWKEVVYMRGRGSLLHANVGCADIIFTQPTTNQAARAAVTALLRLRFLEEFSQTQTVKPIGLGGIPLCPSQYIDYKRSIRIPKEKCDVMVHMADTRHIVVYHKGVWFKIDIYKGGRVVSAAELERSIQMVLDHAEEARKGESHLGALTAGPRDLWARIRDAKFQSGVNADALRLIETSMELIYLDDEERGWDESDISKYEREYERTLTGDGYKVWCDIPSVAIVSKNGRYTTNAEHSVVDAMIYVHIREYTKYHEEFSNLYTPDGHARGEVEVLKRPERIHFDLDAETLSAIDEAYAVSRAIYEDFANAALVFTDYGKDFIKKARVSPDAFIQMALQLTYYKDQGRFDLTYEPAVMRLYRLGRTETVRSCSKQSCAFVKSMLSDKFSAKERLTALRTACDRHQDYYRSAMAGKAIDRHLFGLVITARYYEIKSDFVDTLCQMNYALSTSQTPQHQTVEYSGILNKRRDLFWPAGAFPCPDGSKYGVCYTIATTGDILSFHIAGRKSIDGTDCKRFRRHLVESLREMKAMVEEATLQK